MAAILQRQPLTIKQQVEELKNWHKQQTSKLDLQPLNKENYTNKNNGNKNIKNNTNPSSDFNSISRPNFDEVPIKVANSNFNALVENNVAPVDSHYIVETGKMDATGNKPKFRFLKKGEGIARFNMGQLKAAKKTKPRKQVLSLKLIKEPTKSDDLSRKQVTMNESKTFSSGKIADIPTLNVPDVKLNFTWKSILSGESPEDMLEKAISNNQLDLVDPNSSIDSSTASLMEKLLALGKNKLSRDTEELRVFEAMEKHMLDSSFSSTSSYVNKLMENAVISTPNKNTFSPPHPKTLAQNHRSQLPSKPLQAGGETDSQLEVVSHTTPNYSSCSSVIENSEKIKISTAEKNLDSNQNSNKNSYEPKAPQPVACWTKPETIRNQNNGLTSEESIEDLEHSLHVRFSEQVDYKSFVEHTQYVDSVSQREGSESGEFDESQEWNEGSEDSSSCCSQCSKHDSSNETVKPFKLQEDQLQSNALNSKSKKRIPIQKSNVDLEKNEKLDTDEPSSNEALNNFPPLLVEKLRELEEEIKIFREENSNIRTLKEKLERENKQIQDEKRRLNLEKKRLQKEVEDEQRRLASQLEEEKQKIAKEKSIFEKYSKTLIKNPSREERKEIQALRDQLTEMKEELNKKESRWGAAQARVRNQVKVLEEDNKKLKEEIENFRKQAKYWELFNQKKKGKPYNNTKLIHAISEHISKMVLDDESKQVTFSETAVDLNQNPSAANSSSMTQTDLKSMYGIKVIKESKSNSTLPRCQNAPKSVSDVEDSSRKSQSYFEVENTNGVNNLPCKSNAMNIIADFTINPNSTEVDKENLQNDRCQKPCLEEESNYVIKEVVDENGNVEVVFPNGNVKKINKITGSEKYIYINGDVEEVTHDGIVKYYYSKSRIWQTTLPDGLEIVDFPDGKVEKRHVDGSIEIIFSNNNKKFSFPDGSQEILYADGTRLRTNADKTHILTLPNGQKEIHTEEWKRREYPDGTTKTLYPDGTTETVYSNGRVRLKDKYGNLVMDSDSPPTGTS